MINIAIFSYHTDLHAHAVLQALNRRRGICAHFIPVDAVVSLGGVSWSSDLARKGKLKTYSGQWVRPCDIDLVWWRRVTQALCFPEWLSDEGTRDFVTQEWRAAISGTFFDGFSGIWVNHPSKDSLAANKIYQLTLAKQAGLRIPKTLISQQPSEVREFCAGLDGEVVAKKLVGSTEKSTVSVLVSLEGLQDDESISLCPAVYQECIRSNRHLRVNCFGTSIHTTLIETDIFDWRRKLDVPFIPHTISTKLERTICDFLRIAGLKMGIMDFVLPPDDTDPIWLEVNPQGQFLFCEALSKYDLINPFAEFLIGEALTRGNRSMNAGVANA